MTDLILVLGYIAVLAVIGFLKRYKGDGEEADYLLSGRKLTLPAFIATLVSTWYGGILGVGEYTYQFGISQWFLFGLPYYIFALLFAFFLAEKIRENPALSIPEAVSTTYGKRAGQMTSAGVFLLVNPAPYILMVAALLSYMFGAVDQMLLWAVLVAVFSALYVGFGGFGAVVRTDIIQIVLMYAGFGILLGSAIYHLGSPVSLLSKLSDIQLDPLGGQHWQYALVWFFIALWTFVDPGFHQRAAAAKDTKTARNGILYSILFWGLFDFMSLFTALYASVALPDLTDPMLSYPALSDHLLGPGWNGLFMVALLATIMSTLDSFLFLAGQTLGRDLLKPIFPHISGIRLTQYGIGASVVLAVGLVYLFPSVVQLWYVIGSSVIPALLIPILGVYLSPFAMSQRAVLHYIPATFLTCCIWIGLGYWSDPESYSFAFWGIEPFYPGLFIGLGIGGWDKMKTVSRD